MNKLPPTIRTKSLKRKLRLVATAADNNLGLYQTGTLRDVDEDYRILSRAGKLTRGMIGSAGYPVAPHDLKWRWLDRAKKKRRLPRRGKKLSQPPATQRPYTPPTQPCSECSRDTLRMNHAHTLRHPLKGCAETFCCKCVRMMGYSCPIHALHVFKKLGNPKRKDILHSYDKRHR